MTDAASMKAPVAPTRTNFAHLQEHDEQLVRLGMLAERYYKGGLGRGVSPLRRVVVAQTHEKGPDLSGPFELHRTLPDPLLVAVQGLEPRTLRI